ncbi:MAG: hypothetical protein QM752_05555 [Gammaproteobacteria bacterium]
MSKIKGFLALSSVFVSGAVLLAVVGCKKETPAPQQITIQLVAPAPSASTATPSPSDSQQPAKSTSTQTSHSTSSPLANNPMIIVPPNQVKKQPNVAGQAALTHRAAAAPIRRSLYYSNHHSTD